MGSDCAIRLQGKSAADCTEIACAAEAEVRRIEARYSRYRSDSEIARINRAAASGGSADVDAETAGLITYAFACFALSDGLFDITSGLLRSVWDFSARRLPRQADIDALLPRIGLDKVIWSEDRIAFTRPEMELDFGGIGKEYASDRAAEVCIDLGARHGFVELGGDIRVIGPQVDGLAWRIGIRHPRTPASLAAEVALPHGALATSGDYERFFDVDGRRYCHVVDPKTGWPVQGLSSVTVFADRCMTAGTLSTVAMLKGTGGAEWLRARDVRHIVVDALGRCSGTELPGSDIDINQSARRGV